MDLARVVTGTMARAFGGVAGTGRPCRMDHAGIAHIRDGRGAEAWEIADVDTGDEQQEEA